MELITIKATGMLDNVTIHRHEIQTHHSAGTMVAFLRHLSGDYSFANTIDNPDSLYLIFEMDSTPTDRGLTANNAVFSGNIPEPLPEWMKDGSYVTIEGYMSLYGQIIVQAMTYYSAAGLSHTAKAKA